MKTSMHWLCAAVLALSGVGSAQAALVSALLAGGSITAADKLFDQWSVAFADASDPGFSFNYDNIVVTALADGGMAPGPGLRFDVFNDELTVTGDDSFAYKQLDLRYRVSTLDPTKRINGNSLALASYEWAYTDDASNDLGIDIRTTLGTAAGQDDVSDLLVGANVLDDFETEALSATGAFPRYSQLYVSTFITVWSVDATDTVSLRQLDQRFSQAAVPAPGSLALLLAGLAAARIAGRRTATPRSDPPLAEQGSGFRNHEVQ